MSSLPDITLPTHLYSEKVSTLKLCYSNSLTFPMHHSTPVAVCVRSLPQMRLFHISHYVEWSDWWNPYSGFKLHHPCYVRTHRVSVNNILRIPFLRTSPYSIVVASLFASLFVYYHYSYLYPNPHPSLLLLSNSSLVLFPAVFVATRNAIES